MKKKTIYVMVLSITAEELAEMFHNEYETLAPEFGYKTREASAVAWADVPEQNKQLMIATAAGVLAKLAFQNG